MKHTPGPWSLNGLLVEGPNKELIADARRQDYDKIQSFGMREVTYGQVCPNARLIAAAPKLYEIVRLARNRFANDLSVTEKETIDNLLNEIEGR